MKKIFIHIALLLLVFCVSAHADTQGSESGETAVVSEDTDTAANYILPPLESDETESADASDSEPVDATDDQSDAEDDASTEDTIEAAEADAAETDVDADEQAEAVEAEETEDAEVENLIDSVPPEIVLIGKEYIELEVGDGYDDPGATAEDDVDGDITDAIIVDSLLDTEIPGTYSIAYNVSDEAGNPAEEVVRIIEVLEPPPSVATEKWSAAIQAEGEDLGGVKLCKLKIGIGPEHASLPIPPLPPEYSVNMELIDSGGSSALKDIREEGDSEYMWIIGLDPHGNLGSPESRSATMSWDPAEFGDGTLELRSGPNGSGDVLVADMKETTSYEVTGPQEKQYFTIVFKPE